MLFYIDEDLGVQIQGWLLPENPSATPRVRVESEGREPIVIEAQYPRASIKEQNLHDTGIVGFVVFEGNMPGLSQLTDLRIYAEDTGLLIYARARPGDVDGKLFRLETGLRRLQALDDAVGARFQMSHPGLDWAPSETVHATMRVAYAHSIYVSGRFQLRAVDYVLRQVGFRLGVLVRDPAAELYDRLVSIAAGRPEAGEIAEPAVAARIAAELRGVDLESAAEIADALGRLDGEALERLSDPLTRQLTAAVASEPLGPGAARDALNALADFDVVGVEGDVRGWLESCAAALEQELPFHVPPEAGPPPPWSRPCAGSRPRRPSSDATSLCTKRSGRPTRRPPGVDPRGCVVAPGGVRRHVWRRAARRRGPPPMNAIDIAGPARVPGVSARPLPLPGRRRPAPRRRGAAIAFAILVLLPTAAAAVWAGFVASPRYEATAQFIVRGQTDPMMNASGILSALTAANTSQDSYVAADFLASGAVASEVAKSVDLRAAFARSDADAFSRLPSDASPETIRAYWASMVRTVTDPSSGIVTVKLMAFSAQDASLLLSNALDATQARLESMREAAAAEALARARADVARARERLDAARAGLKAFRDREGVLDAAADAKSVFEVLSGLRTERQAVAVELAVRRASLPAGSPRIRELETRLAAIDARIADVEGRLTAARGGDGAAATAAIRAYEELVFREGLAERFLRSALQDEAEAIALADERQIYLEAFSPPLAPVEAAFPRFWPTVFWAFGVGFFFWATGALLVAGVRDHDT